MIRILRSFFRAAVIETIAIGAIIWIVVASRSHGAPNSGKPSLTNQPVQSAQDESNWFTAPSPAAKPTETRERSDFVNTTLASSADALSHLVSNYLDREIDNVLSQCERPKAETHASQMSRR